MFSVLRGSGGNFPFWEAEMTKESCSKPYFQLYYIMHPWRQLLHSPSRTSAGCKLFSKFMIRSCKKREFPIRKYISKIRCFMTNKTWILLNLLKRCLLKKILKMRHENWCCHTTTVQILGRWTGGLKKHKIAWATQYNQKI